MPPSDEHPLTKSQEDELSKADQLLAIFYNVILENSTDIDSSEFENKIWLCFCCKCDRDEFKNRLGLYISPNESPYTQARYDYYAKIFKQIIELYKTNETNKSFQIKIIFLANKLKKLVDNNDYIPSDQLDYLYVDKDVQTFFQLATELNPQENYSFFTQSKEKKINTTSEIDKKNIVVFLMVFLELILIYFFIKFLFLKFIKS